MEYDFSGWATRNDVRCSDGRTIRQDAFKLNHGKQVPIVWNHAHSDPDNVLGHALLENRPEGVYAYGTFNATKKAKTAKELVKHGDINMMSICANKLKQKGGDVLHGDIIEVSLVLASANPQAYIESVVMHGEVADDMAVFNEFGDFIELYHADKSTNDDTADTANDEPETKTMQDVIDSMTEEQQNVLYAMVGSALEETPPEEDDDEEIEHSEDLDDEGEDYMKHNVFDSETNDTKDQSMLTHSDVKAIIALAKNPAIGTFQNAVEAYVEDKIEGGTLQHGFEAIGELFPDPKDVRPGVPGVITNDHTWTNYVINGVKKVPFSRLRTRTFDARGHAMRAKGYKKGNKKQNTGNMKLLKRTTDPHTIYIKDALSRDDILDITEFDALEFLFDHLRSNLNEEAAMAITVGDGRETDDEHKIDETHIRPIWTDDDLYAIHRDIDIAKVKTELQGTGTATYFGDNYVYAISVAEASLYAREDYRGSGSMICFCTPHLLNVMLMARDRNGHPLYANKNELMSALDVEDIVTAQQFEGLVRKDEAGKKHKLLAIFVNLDDYSVGAVKGGQLTRFDHFNLDFNAHEGLLETRFSGALTRAYSAIVLEEPVADSFQ